MKQARQCANRVICCKSRWRPEGVRMCCSEALKLKLFNYPANNSQCKRNAPLTNGLSTPAPGGWDVVVALAVFRAATLPHHDVARTWACLWMRVIAESKRWTYGLIRRVWLSSYELKLLLKCVTKTHFLTWTLKNVAYISPKHQQFFMTNGQRVLPYSMSVLQKNKTSRIVFLPFSTLLKTSISHIYLHIHLLLSSAPSCPISFL